MTMRLQGISALVSVMVIAISLLTIALVLVSYQYVTTGQNTVTETMTKTKIVNVTTTVASSTYCVQSAAGTLRIIVVHDGTEAPISGATIYGAETDGCGTFAIDHVNTRTNGTVLLSGDVANYFLVANYAGNNYSFSATVYPIRTTNVTLSIPSGNVSVSYSQPFESK
ncbi:MAG: hypothetical protein M1368_07915 [Thaumarchaeota archaeon]|nr:hypothetical protein [Nitrososphaerota archaeon]